MTSWTQVARSLRFYWRTHLGVLLGVTISTAVLVGALVVGDSVQYTLETLALSRLGKVQLALTSQNRYFRVRLADDLGAALDADAAPVLQLRGIAVSGDGTARVNSVQVLGVDDRFWALAPDKATFGTPSADEAVVSQRLADQIGVVAGDDVLLRVEKASLLPRDAPMAIGADSSTALRMTVGSVASDSNFGRFSLRVSQMAPLNAFVPLEWLQERLGLQGRANTLLIGNGEGLSLARANSALVENWELADADLELRELPERDILEFRTGRVFLDPTAASAARRAMPRAVGVLTYFVNELRVGRRTTPYSVVAAMEDALDLAANGYTPRTTHDGPELGDDEILINTWLAADLEAEPGDSLELAYFVFGPMHRLEERTSSFRIRGILPVEGAAADPDLMPEFPGLSDAENCRDWDPGIPIDLNRIREKDEEYWNEYGGTPKALVTLVAGQRMWGNRFGNLTALRYPIQADTGKTVSAAIKSELDPASLGLVFQPVRKQALAASAQAMDFGQLFLGLSFFLIAAALLLTGLLFVFGIEQRTEEVGTLLSLGFRPHRVRRLLLFEGGTLALLGGLLGAGAGVLYTKAVLRMLSTVWKGAVSTADFQYHAGSLTLIVGTAAGIATALIAIWVSSRRQAGHPARELLAIGVEFESRRKNGESGVRTRPIGNSVSGLLVAAIAGAVALAVLVVAGTGRDARTGAAFFFAGGLLLVCCLGLCHSLLSVLARSSRISRFTARGMGLRNSARRWGRSLATIGLLACGSFLIVSIGANRHDPLADAGERWSGTGGFALYGESTLPVIHDLNSEDGRRAYRMDASDLEGVEFVPFRVHDGDDASCLNLNRPQSPRLLGALPGALAERETFTFVKTLDNMPTDSPWLLLDSRSSGDTVNAIADQNTISWSLGKSVGDTLPYTDEMGKTFHVRIVGSIASSVLQGGLIVSEDEFTRRFPSEGGYRTFLIDVPSGTPVAGKGVSDDSIGVREVSRTLTRALRDVGLELTPTADRLADFNTVENTYLSIFQALGGLALLLGSLGLGIVVMRNVMERRSELALLRAVGFHNRSLRRMIFSEHRLLLLLGLGCGVAAGLVAVLPALHSPGADIPYASLTVTLSAVVFSGALWTWLATRLAVHGSLLAALRNE